MYLNAVLDNSTKFNELPLLTLKKQAKLIYSERNWNIGCFRWSTDRRQAQWNNLGNRNVLHHD